MVGIPDPAARVDAYPHQLSGGLKQRVMIAMAMAMQPRLLIADEPTTALDATIRAQILELIRNLAATTGTAVLLITHDLGVVNEVADRVAVMYAGQIVEEGTREELLSRAAAPLYAGAAHAPFRGRRRAGGGWTRSRASCRGPDSGRPAAASIRAARCVFDRCRSEVPARTAFRPRRPPGAIWSGRRRGP